MGEIIQIEHHLTVDGEAYDLLWLDAHDALDTIGVVRCEMTDGAGGPEPALLVGKKLEVTLRHPDGRQIRHFVAYVDEAERTTTRGDEQTETGTRVVGRPRLSRLTRRADCKIFQEVSAPDIVKQVLGGGGISEADQKWQLAGSYPKRTYTTQYRESDYNFVRRVLSEEGIAFAVDTSSGTDVVVFFDSDLGDVDGEKWFPFGVGDGLTASREAIGTLSHEKSTTPGKVHLRDYDFERPRLGLDPKAEGDDDEEKSLEVYVYPGRFTDLSVGDRYAKVLVESLRARREVVAGATSTLRLLPGRKFELGEHPYEPLNQEYLVLSVGITFEARRWTGAASDGVSEAQAAPHGARIEFRAIPTAKTAYRPAQLPRAASIPGPQTAVTTGPPGKEIHPDLHGRVKVLFPWDRLGKPDDSSSRWMRTCQLPLGGSMLTPRVGWEVYLNFIDGDPDQPFVFGRMYNAKTPPPYPLPKNKTRMTIQTATTPGGGSTNELRMEDKAGSEEMFMNASKDTTIAAGNNATEGVGSNETRSIGANHTLTVTDSIAATVGGAQSLAIAGNQTVNVGTFMVDDVGSHSQSIGGSRDLKAGGDHKRTVTGPSTLTIGGMQLDLVAGSADEEGLATMDDTVGAALVEMTATNRTVTVTGTRKETAGAAKVILAGGGRSVQVGAGLSQKVAGAILTKIKGARADSSTGDFLEVAGGAQIVKATNVVFEATSLLSIVMGGSTITLTPSSVTIVGVKVTIHGACDQHAALVTDN